MALFYECTLQCAQKELDTADIVRDAWLRHSSSDEHEKSQPRGCKVTPVAFPVRKGTQMAYSYRRATIGSTLVARRAGR
jgi:hypothetical protein